MALTFAQVSSAGPVRLNNEDFLGFLQPEDAEGAAQPRARARRFQ
ncbi:MAG TPA: hypothetical protein VG013_28375 [Gemmataceae bacterium]|jgi:hypothetical protein|nr:hypothetical protein [Gemmataceae bacterium]